MKAKTVQLMLVMHSASHLPCSFCYISVFEYVKFIDTTRVSWEDLFSYKSVTANFTFSPVCSLQINCEMVTSSHLMFWEQTLYQHIVSPFNVLSTSFSGPIAASGKISCCPKKLGDLWGIFPQGESHTNIEWKPIALCFPLNGICINYWWCLSLLNMYIWDS